MIPFPRAVRDELLAQGRASQHHWVRDSGWTTFCVRSATNVEQAPWLLRLSYLRYALKHAADARGTLDQASDEIPSTPRLNALPASTVSV